MVRTNYQNTYEKNNKNFEVCKKLTSLNITKLQNYKQKVMLNHMIYCNLRRPILPSIDNPQVNWEKI